jgi:hypothetical protein
MKMNQSITTIIQAAIQPGAKSEQIPSHKSVSSIDPPIAQSEMSTHLFIIILVMM